VTPLILILTALVLAVVRHGIPIEHRNLRAAYLGAVSAFVLAAAWASRQPIVVSVVFK
jgi:hypothetical protein